LVAAETTVPTMLWVLLIGGALFVVPLIFVVTSRAGPRTQAALVAASSMFTVVMVMLVYILSTPFAAESGRVTPRLIEETTRSMQRQEPTLDHCEFAGVR
jgi:Na+/phosphate symporter